MQWSECTTSSDGWSLLPSSCWCWCDEDSLRVTQIYTSLFKIQVILRRAASLSSYECYISPVLGSPQAFPPGDKVIFTSIVLQVTPPLCFHLGYKVFTQTILLKFPVHSVLLGNQILLKIWKTNQKEVETDLGSPFFVLLTKIRVQKVKEVGHITSKWKAAGIIVQRKWAILAQGNF